MTQHQLSQVFQGLQPSATLRINERSVELARQGHRIYRLGFGQSPFPVPVAVVEALRANAHQKDYLPVRGLAPLREAVAQFHHRQQGLPTTTDDVLIGPGSKELMFLLQLVGDHQLLLPCPSWVSYLPQAKIAAKGVAWLPTTAKDRWLPTAAALDEFCLTALPKQRLLLLNYPCNPTGSTFRPDELEALAAVARKHGLLVLSDEIYGEVHHTGAHQSIARHYPEGTIVSSGLSKWCGAGGWRLGTFIFPKNLRNLLDAMAVAASETFTSVSAPIQHAAVSAYLPSADIDAYLASSRQVLRTVGLAASQMLTEAGLPHTAPAGGFYLFPDFEKYREPLASRGIRTSAVFCEKLLDETGVALLPSSDFGFAPEVLAARLSYVDFDGASSLENPAAPAPVLAPKVLEAIGRMAEWVRLSQKKKRAPW